MSIPVEGCRKVPFVNKKSTRVLTAVVHKRLDNVDKLLSEQLFAYFYDISGSHSYQQISVYTFFK